MLEKLLKDPHVLARHLDAPLVEERRRYLAHKAGQGYAEASLIGLANEVLLVSMQFRHHQCSASGVLLQEIEDTAGDWAAKQCRDKRARTARWSRAFFLRVAIDFFRFLGRLSEPIEEPQWYTHLLEDYRRFMECERGLSRKTVHNLCWHAENFLRSYAPSEGTLSSVRMKHVEEFLNRCHSKGWCRSSLASCASALRAFFRHAAMRLWCDSRLPQLIERPRLFGELSVPTGPTWDEVRRLADSIGNEDPADIRARAIVLLLAVYALRPGEIANLRLRDIAWQESLITITRTKQRRTQIYPLTATVGNALIHYLQEVRKPSAHREVFLTLRAPFRPVSIQNLYQLVSARMAAAGIPREYRGPNRLRHACATHLLSEGLSLTEIADHLGHRRLDTTRIYAKVDLPNLREVGNFNFGGLL